MCALDAREAPDELILLDGLRVAERLWLIRAGVHLWISTVIGHILPCFKL